MLVKFAVTNYRGFADRIEWDLSKPSDYSFNTFAIKDGIIKNGVIASGAIMHLWMMACHNLMFWQLYVRISVLQ